MYVCMYVCMRNMTFIMHEPLKSISFGLLSRPFPQKPHTLPSFKALLTIVCHAATDKASVVQRLKTLRCIKAILRETRVLATKYIQMHYNLSTSGENCVQKRFLYFSPFSSNRLYIILYEGNLRMHSAIYIYVRITYLYLQVHITIIEA